MTTPFTVVIPARYGSSRFPGKPLADILGQTMIERVYRQALQSQATRVVVATDDQRIADACEGFGAQVCMTREDHPSGTDRLQEVAAALGLGDDEIVVNVQGDEPLIPPVIIDQVAGNLANAPQASISTLSEPIDDVAQLLNPNVVKVVANVDSIAMYFSRAPIAYARDFSDSEGVISQAAIDHNDDFSWQRHIGIYGYRVGFLNRFVQWGEAPLERIERLEQLRAMWNGELIHVAPALEKPFAGVDTPEDLAAIEAHLNAKAV